MCRLRSDDAGFSLIEMVVATSLMLLVMAIIGPSIIATQRTVATSNQRVTDLGQAQVAISAVSRSLRPATPAAREPAILEAGAERVELYSNIGDEPDPSDTTPDAPTHVVVQAITDDDGGRLVLTTTAGTYVEVGGVREWAPHPAAAARTRVLAHGLADTAIFQYHDSSGAPFVPTADQLDSIRSITITLTIAGAPDRAGESQLRQQIRLPNLQSRD